jgi:hypothetical protein
MRDAEEAEGPLLLRDPPDQCSKEQSAFSNQPSAGNTPLRGAPKEAVCAAFHED